MTPKNKIFNENPELKEFYMTSDGQAFYQESDAKNHARGLEDKKVEHCVRVTTVADVKEIKPEAEETEAAEDGEDRDALVEKYIELYDKKPAANMKIETLLKKIAEKEAEEAEETENTEDDEAED